jgi:hypothetical protein
MDPIQLASIVLTALAPFAVKGGEAVAGELGKQALAGGERVIKALWTRWRGNTEREASLAAFVAGVDGAAEALKLAIAVEAASGPNFAETLRTLIAGEEPKVDVEQVAEDGRTMTGAEIAEMIRGRVKVKQTGKGVKNLRGAVVGTLGGPPSEPKKPGG